MPAKRAFVAEDSVSNNGTVNATPPDDTEVLIQSVYSTEDKKMEVYRTDDDGSTFYLIATTFGGRYALALGERITETSWLQLKNVSGGSSFIGAAGVTTYDAADA